MNTAIAVLILSFFGTLANAQENEKEQVPANVMMSFHELHPGVKDVAWKYNELNFEASFRLNGKAVSLLFDQDGCVNEAKNEIMLFELPMDVNTMLAKEYSGWRVGKASHIDASGTDYYETIVEKGKQTIVLVFNRHGGLLVKVIQ